MTANTPHTRKAKGRKFQQAICADILSAFDIDEKDILSTGMGQAGCDIYLSPAARVFFPFGVECKNQETWKIHKWWKQCTVNAEAENLSPLLVVKKNGRPPLAVIEWHRLVSLIADAVPDYRDRVSAADITGGPGPQ